MKQYVFCKTEIIKIHLALLDEVAKHPDLFPVERRFHAIIQDMKNNDCIFCIQSLEKDVATSDFLDPLKHLTIDGFEE